LADRVAEIQEANGFRTDAGLHLFYGPTNLGPSDPQLGIAIVPGDTTTRFDSDQGGEGASKTITLPIEFHAIARDDLDDTLVKIESLIGDIKRAVELPDVTLDKQADSFEPGEVGPLPRVPGSTTIGARVGYVASYTEPWGQPEVE
jgi:hypothetical protein